MRYAVFSDIHSNLEAFEAVLAAYAKEGIDKFLCIGDVVGYGASPAECIEKIRETTAFTCAGNHDWASVGLFSTEYFNPYAASAVIWTRNILRETDKTFLKSLKLTFKDNDLTFVHGTLNKPGEFNYMTGPSVAEETFEVLETVVCFVGHTHCPGIFSKEGIRHATYRKESEIYLEEGRRYIVDVGSVGQPRDGNADACYCVYDSDRKLVSIKRAKYDCKLARQKILDEGLPEILGDRLLTGS